MTWDLEPSDPEAAGGNEKLPTAAGRYYRALGAPTRLRILQLLGERKGPCTVSEVARRIGISLPSASRNLSALDSAGLIERARRGNHVVCRLSAAGARALNEAVAVANASGPTAQPRGGAGESLDRRHASGLSETDPEEVEFYLIMGLSLHRPVRRERAAWDAHMIDLFGPAITPNLPVLHAAASRILGGEALDGLPLPPGLLALGLAPFASFVS